MKKIATLLLGALMAIPAVARDFEYEYEGQTLVYTVISETAKTCKTKEGSYDNSTYTPGNAVSGDLILPEHPMDGDTEFTLTEITYASFAKCSELTSIKIPESVTSCGSSAFRDCTGLTKAEFASIEHLCSIDFSIINGASNPLEYAHHLYIDGEEVTEVVIPDSVKKIGYRTFYGCSSLTSIEILKGVTSIGSCAFYGCSSLTSIEIPSSVTSIGSSAFRDCSSLTSIEIPEGVTSIGESAFRDCSSLTSIEIPNSVKSISSYAFYGCSSLTSIEIPEGVTSIREWAFTSCKSLTSIKIHEGVTSIGSRAFSGCSSLISIEIPEGVTSISPTAFEHCSSLTSINIPEGVTFIGNYTFYGCSSLTSIEIPEGVTSIGNSAFSGCSSLTSVIIPPSVTELGENAFKNCSNLQKSAYPSALGESPFPSGISVAYPEGAVIVDGVIYSENQDELLFVPIDATEYEIPRSVESIGENAFTGCSQLTTLKVDSDTPPQDLENIFTPEMYQNITLVVPEWAEEEYRNSEPWNNFENITTYRPFRRVVKISPEAVTLIAGDSFNLTVEKTNIEADEEVTWTSSDTSVATVDETGHVTAVAEGTATITATCMDAEDTAEVTVTAKTDVLEPAIKVTPEAVSLVEGDSFNLTVEKTDLDADAEVVWTSSDEKVATVDENGHVTAVAEGTATITATCMDAEDGAVVTVTAKTDVANPAIKITPEAVSLVEGDSFSLTVEKTDLDADAVVTWTSSDNKVATVDETGHVIAVAEGTATITATCQGVKATAAVTVSAKSDVLVPAIKVTPEAVSLVEGDSFSLTVEKTDLDADAVVTWTSSDNKVATVDETGHVIAIAEGTATITATCQGVKATAAVTVSAKSDVLEPAIKVTPEAVSLVEGDSFNLTVEKTDLDADAEVVWTSSDASVATVDETGHVTAVSEGTATITATCEGAEDSVEVTVTAKTDVANPAIKITPEAVSLVEGDATTLTTEKTDIASDAEVIWTSSDTSVATVDENGKVTAVSEGTATITATCEGAEDSAVVTVTAKTDVANPAIKVIPEAVSLVEGDSFNLTVEKTDLDADAVVIWTSSNTSVATVDASGHVTAVGEGTATITATCQGVKATAAVTVSAKSDVLAPAIKVTPEAVSLVEGDSFSLTVEKTDLDADAEVVWTSSNTSVATVDAAGHVTAIAEGTATITATCQGVKATVAVTVSAKSDVKNPTIEVTPAAIALVEGDAATLSIRKTDIDSGAEVTWSSSDPSVATVDSNGKVTAVGEGTATITASCQGVEGTAEVTVTAKTTVEPDEPGQEDGIDAAESAAKIEVYDLRGVKVGDSLDGLPTGIYIVRQGNEVKKVAVK